MLKPYCIKAKEITEAVNKSIKDIYVEQMRTYAKTRTCDLDVDNYRFKTTYSNNKSLTKSIMMRLKNEYTTFRTLPIEYDASIISRPDENNMRAIRTLITGPLNTPYEHGIFIFDTYIVDAFPSSPPQVLLVNTGGIRFNPNLYDSGKVCLSILGTWSGQKSEEWNKDTSTLLQIYMSIQSQILVDEPYYNEPGYETHDRKEVSKKYNQQIRLYTMQYAILALIKDLNYIPQFADIIAFHFKTKKNEIIDTCMRWVDEAPSSLRGQYDSTLEEIKKYMDKL